MGSDSIHQDSPDHIKSFDSSSIQLSASKHNLIWRP